MNTDPIFKPYSRMAPIVTYAYEGFIEDFISTKHGMNLFFSHVQA